MSTITYSQALEKLKYYCAYQERCHQEVKNKLWDFKLSQNERENIVVELISQNYLNEERFAESYAEGKFRIKKWGRVKIKQKLKEKQVSDYCIKKGLSAIEEEEYIETLTQLIRQKYYNIKDTNLYKKKVKTINYCYQKGYETDLAWEILNKEIDSSQ